MYHPRRDAIRTTTDTKAKLLSSLKSEIVTGLLQPGEPLRQDEIAQKYSLSRMPVREAFRELEVMGLLQVVPNSGAFVAPLDSAELRENFEMRAAAECLALRVAIPELNNRQLEEAGQIHSVMSCCNADEYSIINNKFHLRLYSPCGRPRLLAHISALNTIAERYINLAIGNFDYSSKSDQEHGQILEACQKRDAELATQLLFDHITTAGEHLESAFFQVRSDS